MPEALAICFGPTRSSPRNGQGNVPLDAVVLVGGADAPTELALASAGVELAVLPGELLRGTGPPLYRYAIPPGLLQPTTAYTLSLDDREFRTGSREDDQAPPAPTITEWWLAHAQYDLSDTGYSEGSDYLDFRLGFAPDSDAALYELTLTSSAGDQRLALLPAELSNVGSGSNCTLAVPAPLPRGEEVCVTARARDLAGNLSAPSTACTVNLACQPVSPDGFDRDLSDCAIETSGCSAAAGGASWLVAALVVAAVAGRPGRRLARVR